MTEAWEVQITWRGEDGSDGGWLFNLERGNGNAENGGNAIRIRTPDETLNYSQ